MSTLPVDLNLDAGELPEAMADGREEALYDLVTSVNVACGGHAGDEGSMEKSVDWALKRGLRIGAHPSYPDREGFGRKVPSMDPKALIESLVAQILCLQNVCEKRGVRLTHVKPHGALYNVAARDKETARSVIDAILKVNPSLVLVGLAESMLLGWARESGLTAMGEAFVDRRYEEDGSLRSRQYPDALILDPGLAAQQAVKLVREGSVTSVAGRNLHIRFETLCIHGDSPGALAIARAVHSALLSSV